MEQRFRQALPQEFVYQTSTSYADLHGSHYLRVPRTGSFLQNPLPLSPRPSRFVVAYEKDVTLIGANTYLTKNGTFYTDEQLTNTSELEGYLRRAEQGRLQGIVTRRDGQWLIAEVAERPTTIDQPVVSLASLEPSNYGSWLFRFVPKLIECRYDLPILVYYNSARWMKEIISFFHGQKTIIFHSPDKQYFLNEAYIPSCRNADVFFDLETREFYRNCAQKLPSSRASDKIYLSRQSRQNIRPIVNEPELIVALEGLGFVAVRPEELPFDQQYALIANARSIVCPGGSGLFNMVLAARAEFVLDIEPGREWLYPHHNILRSCQIPHAIAIGERQDPTLPHGPWAVNVQDIVAALREFA